MHDRLSPREAQRLAASAIAEGSDARFEKVGQAPDGLPIYGQSNGEALSPAERRTLLGLDEHADMLSMHGNVLRDRGKFAASAVAFRRALGLCPNNSYLLSGLGAACWFLARYDEAEDHLKHALRINPADVSAHTNMGTLLGTRGAIKQMRWHFDRALAIEPGNPSARWNYAMALLNRGLWLDAWPHYDVRMEYQPAKFPKLPYPLWKGEGLDGKTLYIQAEQGLGDRVMFSRYVHWVHEIWPTARILWLTDAPPMPDTRPLLWEFRKFVEFLPAGTPWPEDVDYGIFEMSLPGVHGTTPTNLPADPGLIRRRVMADEFVAGVPDPLVPAIKVGVCWAGGPAMARNDERSMPLELMLQLEELPNVQLYSLQFAPGRNDIGRVESAQLMMDLSRDIEVNSGTHPLVATCAVMAHLDLVVTVCTANAHLAGVMGVPVWVPLCHDPYWVWLRKRSDSVWYPNARLYRQSAPGDWQGVVDKMKEDLARLASKTLRDRKNLTTEKTGVPRHG